MPPFLSFISFNHVHLHHILVSLGHPSLPMLPPIFLLLLSTSYSAIVASPLSTVSISQSSNVTVVCALVPSSIAGDGYNLTCTSLLPIRQQITYTYGSNIASSALAGGYEFLCHLSLSPNISSMVWWDLSEDPGDGWGNDYKLVYHGAPLVDLSAGDSHVCAIHAGGQPACWRWKQLHFEEGINFSDIAVGGDFVCGLLRESMEIKCVGNDTSVVGHEPPGSYREIAAGSRHACAVSAEGRIACFGPGAPEVTPPYEASSLALGEDTTCALGRSGKVACWGENSTLPCSVAATEFMAIQARGRAICGIIRENYSLACWGTEDLYSEPIVYERILPGPCVPSSSCPCGPLEGSGTLCFASNVVCHLCENEIVVMPPNAPYPPGLPPTPLPTLSSGEAPAPHRRRTGLIVVGSVGFAIGLVASLCFCILHFGRCKGRVAPSLIPRPRSEQSLQSPAEFRLSSLLLGRGRHSAMVEEFQLSTILAATGNFAESYKIGSGSFGSVYRATMADGRVVAIKRAEGPASSSNTTAAAGNKRADKEWAFLAELALLSRVNHRNLVRLLGYCTQGSERLLVYEFMANGTLHDNLHRLPAPGAALASWRDRLRVALDAARGLEYLHVYAVPPIIHRDIKSSNILLDDAWTAKVSDFGLSLMSPAGEEAGCDCPGGARTAGTVGYMDPEYYRLQHLTAKSDVYSFGVVLLELLTGCKVINRYEGSGTPKNVVDFAVPHIAADDVHRVLDPKLPPPTPSEIEAVTYVGYLAIDCVSPEGRERPTMTEVVNGLERAVAACEVPAASLSRSDTIRSA